MNVVSALVSGQVGWGLHVVGEGLGSGFCSIATCTSAMVSLSLDGVKSWCHLAKS